MLLVLVLGAVLLTALPDDEDDANGEGAACGPRSVRSWRAETALTEEFARYGDDGTRSDDWTGGDGTHSVRLPDGRVLWLFSDTFLGAVHRPPNPVGESVAWRDVTTPLVRNSAVVMSESGRLLSTLPAPVFPDPAPGQWRWPVAARVEPRSPGSAERVVRVLLWTRTQGDAPWIYGVPLATEVATLSLPDLRPEGIKTVLDERTVTDPARRVLFGTTAVDAGAWTYVFGGDDARAASRPVSSAHVARVPRGRLGEPAAWEFWDGEEWTVRGRPAPVLGDDRGRGVGSAFTVIRDGSTYVLFTMAAGTAGLSRVSSYWACSPTGPWHGPAEGFEAPLPETGTAAYNPQAHPALDDGNNDSNNSNGDGGRLVLSYDVNRLDDDAARAQLSLSRNVSLYRPRFVSLRLTAE